jgi:enoyl-CoA hydratase/carnithine racemase
MVRRFTGRPFEQSHLEAEQVFLGELMPSEDVREGIASFYEKREPVWKNR